MISTGILNSLEKDLLKLYEYTNSFNGTMENQTTMETKSEEILKGLRKIIIANEFLGKNIICVSGLQGAGKTTFVKNYYHLDDNVLDATLSRGEKLPILITETGQKVPLTFRNYIKNEANSCVKVREEIDYETFKEKSSNLLKDDDTTMYLEIEVDYLHNHDDSKSIMLLPGYESNKKDYWQTLIDLSVSCADMALFVFNESGFSTNLNNSELNKIKDEFGNNTVYIISHLDQSSDDHKDVKKECRLLMDIEDEDKIISVGDFVDKNRNEEWINNVEKVINKYSNDSQKVFENYKKYILNIINSELHPALRNIMALMKDDLSYESIYTNNIKNILDEYDNEYKKNRKKLQRELHKQLQTNCDESSEKLLNTLKKTKKRHFKQILGLNGLEEQQEINKIINDSLKNDDFLIAHEGVYKATKNIISTLITNGSNMIEVKDKEKIKNNLQLIENDKMYLVAQDVITLMDEKKENYELKSSDNKMLCKITNDYATFYFGQRILDDYNLKYNHFSKKENVEAYDKVIDEIYNSKNFLNIKKKNIKDALNDKESLKSIMGVTGLGVVVDVVDDRIINGSAFEPLKSLVPTLFAVTIAIDTINFANQLMKDINNIKKFEYVYCTNAIKTWYLDFENYILEEYDEFNYKIKERLENNLRRKNNIGKNQIIRTNVLSKVSQIEENLKIIKKEVKKDEYDYARAFK